MNSEFSIRVIEGSYVFDCMFISDTWPGVNLDTMSDLLNMTECH